MDSLFVQHSSFRTGSHSHTHAYMVWSATKLGTTSRDDYSVAGSNSETGGSDGATMIRFALLLLMLLVASSAFAQALTVNPLTVSIKQKETAQLTVTSNGSPVTADWSSRDSTIATVSATGLVTGIGKGTVPITASYNGATATCSVSVAKP